MVNELEIPYLSHEDIRRHAENFLYRNNKKDSIPVSIEKIIETAKWLEGPLGAAMPAMVSRAGTFPPEAA